MNILEEMEEVLREDSHYDKFKDREFEIDIMDDLEAKGVDDEDKLADYIEDLRDMVGNATTGSLIKKINWLDNNFDRLVEEF